VLLTLTNLTIDQSQSHDRNSLQLWKFTRKIRLTTTTAADVPNKNTTDPKTFLRNHVFGKFRGNNDTARGNYGEGLARMKYTELTGIEVMKSGVHVNSTGPWLAASPDGLISTNSSFEVKCPDPDKFEGYLLQKSYEIEKLDTGEYKLRKKEYYTKIQLCMFCLKRASCIFMIYLGPDRDAHVLSVYYDKDFIEDKRNVPVRARGQNLLDLEPIFDMSSLNLNANF